MFLAKIKGKYNEYKKQKAKEKEIYEKTLAEEKLKYAKYKAEMKVLGIKNKAKEVAKAGGKIGYALKKIREADVNLKKINSKKAKKQREYMNVFQ